MYNFKEKKSKGKIKMDQTLYIRKLNGIFDLYSML